MEEQIEGEEQFVIQYQQPEQLQYKTALYLYFIASSLTDSEINLSFTCSLNMQDIKCALQQAAQEQDSKTRCSDNIYSCYGKWRRRS